MKNKDYSPLLKEIEKYLISCIDLDSIYLTINKKGFSIDKIYFKDKYIYLSIKNNGDYKILCLSPYMYKFEYYNINKIINIEDLKRKQENIKNGVKYSNKRKIKLISTSFNVLEIDYLEKKKKHCGYAPINVEKFFDVDDYLIKDLKSALKKHFLNTKNLLLIGI